MITPEGALHFPRLFTAEEFQGKVKYGCRIVFDKGVTPETGLSEIADAIVALATKEWGGNLPASFKQKFPLKQLDDGRWYFTARRNEDIGRPGIVDGSGQAVSDRDRMYPGLPRDSGGKAARL